MPTIKARALATRILATPQIYNPESRELAREVQANTQGTPTSLFLSEDRLTGLLQEAKRAHAAFERETAKPDPDWPGWYARYILTILKEEHQ